MKFKWQSALGGAYIVIELVATRDILPSQFQMLGQLGLFLLFLFFFGFPHFKRCRAPARVAAAGLLWTIRDQVIYKVVLETCCLLCWVTQNAYAVRLVRPTGAIIRA